MRQVETRIHGTKGETEMISEQEFYARLTRFPDEDADDQPTCCNGAGFVRRERPVGHSLFGQYQKCPACTPWRVQTEAAPWAK